MADESHAYLLSAHCATSQWQNLNGQSTPLQSDNVHSLVQPPHHRFRLSLYETRLQAQAVQADHLHRPRSFLSSECAHQKRT